LEVVTSLWKVVGRVIQKQCIVKWLHGNGKILGIEFMGGGGMLLSWRTWKYGETNEEWQFPWHRFGE